MSVTFNRTALIKVSKAALVEDTAAQVKYREAVDKYKAHHAAEYNIVALRNFRDWLTKQLKSGEPVSAPGYDVTNGGNITGLFYSPPSDYGIERAVTAPKGLLKPAERIEIGALLQVLESATGDSVSVNELKLLGLKNLAPIFTAAAQAAK